MNENELLVLGGMNKELGGQVRRCGFAAELRRHAKRCGFSPNFDYVPDGFFKFAIGRTVYLCAVEVERTHNVSPDKLWAYAETWFQFDRSSDTHALALLTSYGTPWWGVVDLGWAYFDMVSDGRLWPIEREFSPEKGRIIESCRGLRTRSDLGPVLAGV